MSSWSSRRSSGTRATRRRSSCSKCTTTASRWCRTVRGRRPRPTSPGSTRTGSGPRWNGTACERGGRSVAPLPRAPSGVRSAATRAPTTAQAGDGCRASGAVVASTGPRGARVTRIDPRRGGGATVRLERVEVEALRDLASQVDGLFAGGVPEHGADPVRDRLFPRAYVDPTEDRSEAEFQSVVHDDLVRAKSDAVAGLLAGLDGTTDRRGRLTLELAPADVEQW